ncbi:XRE family transcriptional regulator [Mesorhizobium sp. M1A.F.Ca.IN.020.03.2.1]|nr:XRE family transcriptional regulator [Mesorhizobium sp. M1A.F.Ca.IN.020.03.2.1]RWF83623.1 MAG: XRE family transcriptional regulator [Mesorhizobium sp.]RWH04613.1 MAG: XRE family transcriptional regulator [Mesorhizobium sp.]TIN65491.1 MAG: helix-turn-helix transcriptional regulator [Mesorhizobium sp.]
MQVFHGRVLSPIWLQVKACNHSGTVSQEIVLSYRIDMANGIKHFREKAGLTKAELARRVGTTRPQMGRLEEEDGPNGRKLTLKWAERIAPHLNVRPEELMFPELAAIDVSKFNQVFEIAGGKNQTPGLVLDPEFLARMLPNSTGHNLRFMMVDAYQANGIVAKGDALVIDLDDNTPNRPGIFALEIAGAVQWRYLSPTTAGAVQVHNDNPAAVNETVQPKDLKVIGRARLRISTL